MREAIVNWVLIGKGCLCVYGLPVITECGLKHVGIVSTFYG